MYLVIETVLSKSEFPSEADKIVREFADSDALFKWAKTMAVSKLSTIKVYEASEKKLSLSFEVAEPENKRGEVLGPGGDGHQPYY